MSVVSPGEIDAVQKCVAGGRKYGHGNMIDRLKIAWALDLYTRTNDPKDPLFVEGETFSLVSAFRSAGLNVERAERPGEVEEKLRWMRKYTGDNA